MRNADSQRSKRSDNIGTGHEKSEPLSTMNPSPSSERSPETDRAALP